VKMFPTIGCCGIDCGLCPRFYTAGSSRCPGCGGEGFESVHPPCAVKSCADRYGLEACGQCDEFPCKKYSDREKVERDSFVTHKRIFHNHDIIAARGIDWFLSEQGKRISILQDMLANYEDGRSKSFFCLAAALLQTEHLLAAIAETPNDIDKKSRGKALKTALQKYADIEGVRLTLNK